MPQYFAAALARDPDVPAWVGREIDLHVVEDLDGVTDLLRDLSEQPDPALLFVEEDDEYVGIVRLDPDGDPRVFLSDRRVVERSGIAAMLYADAAAAALPAADEDESARPVAEPIGDADLLADLGTPAAALIDLCGEEGLLPADVITALCERAGCAEVLEELRG